MIVFRWSAMPHLKGVCPSAPQFFGAFLFMLTPFVTELPNFTHWEGRGLFLGGWPLPHLKGGVQAHHSIYPYNFCRRTTILTWKNMSGRNVYLGVSQASYPKKAKFQCSQFLGFSRVYTYIH